MCRAARASALTITRRATNRHASLRLPPETSLTHRSRMTASNLLTVHTNATSPTLHKIGRPLEPGIPQQHPLRRPDARTREPYWLSDKWTFLRSPLLRGVGRSLVGRLGSAISRSAYATYPYVNGDLCHVLLRRRILFLMLMLYVLVCVEDNSFANVPITPRYDVSE